MLSMYCVLYQVTVYLLFISMGSIGSVSSVFFWGGGWAGGILTDLIKVVDIKTLYYWSCVESVAKFLFLFGWFSDIFELFEAPQYQSINSNVGRQNLHFILLNNRSIWRFTHFSDKPTRCFYMRLKTSISNYFSLLRYHISV